jgi:hypothetical protein
LLLPPAEMDGSPEELAAEEEPVVQVEQAEPSPAPCDGDASQLPLPPAEMDSSPTEAEAVEALDSADGYEPELAVVEG